jgi:medium-chain acyl-[acyl-carrier-protein] hydrolase
MSGRNDWFITFKKNNNAKVRLFCFHYAGGSASAFKEWKDDVAECSELTAIQLPGRENRYSEQLLYDIDHIINDLYLNILAYLDKPYVFFGHSLGAIIAFELTRVLRRSGKPQPKHLIIAGTRAPHIDRSKDAIHTLDDTRFTNKLMMYNGISQSLLEDKELLGIFLPIIRADFCLSETYKCESQKPLSCPITALGGSSDFTFPHAELLEWKDHTLGTFVDYKLNGDHFFIKSSYREVIKIVNNVLLNKNS